jgi:hypothetical protein
MPSSTGSQLYTPSTAVKGAELDAVAVNSIVDGLSSLNINAAFTNGQALYTSGVMSTSPTSITLTSLPLYGTYAIMFFGRSNAAVTTDVLTMRINGDTNSNHYISQNISGGNATTSSVFGTQIGLIISGSVPGSSDTASYSTAALHFLTGVKVQGYQLPSMTGIFSNWHTSSAAATGMVVNSYSTGLANVSITSVTFFLSSGGSFANGSSLSVYGLG